MISFAGSDFFFNNSGFLFRSLFFLQNRFLLQKFRCQLPATCLSSTQISSPRSDSLLQIGVSLLQYDFFFPVRFLTAKLPLPLPICFLFPGQIPRRKLEDLFCSMISFPKSDFLPQNSPSASHDLFFFPIRFLFRNRLRFCPLGNLRRFV